MTLSEMEALKSPQGHRGWKTAVIDSTFGVGSGAAGMQDAIARVCEEASRAIQGEYGTSGVQVWARCVCERACVAEWRTRKISGSTMHVFQCLFKKMNRKDERTKGREPVIDSWDSQRCAHL